MSTLHPKRQTDKAHLKLIRSMGCIACEIAGVQQTSPTSAHHIRRKADGSLYGAGQKASDMETIPLCQTDHWNGVDSVWTHRGFEERFGNERALLAMVLDKIKRGEAA